MGRIKKKFDESLLVRRGMKSQRARTNAFLLNSRSGRDEKRPERRLQTKERNSVIHRSRRGHDAAVISFVRIRPIRPIRPIRVQTSWSRPGDRATIKQVSARF